MKSSNKKFSIIYRRKQKKMNLLKVGLDYATCLDVGSNKILINLQKYLKKEAKNMKEYRYMDWDGPMGLDMGWSKVMNLE